VKVRSAAEKALVAVRRKKQPETKKDEHKDEKEKKKE